MCLWSSCLQCGSRDSMQGATSSLPPGQKRPNNSPPLLHYCHTVKTTSRCPWRGWDLWDIPPLTIIQQVKDWTAVAGSQTDHRLWQDAWVIVKGGWVMNWNRRSNRTDTDFSGQQGRDKHNGWTGEKRDLQVTWNKTIERAWKRVIKKHTIPPAIWHSSFNNNS